MNTTGVTWKRHFPAEKSGAQLFPEFEMRAKAVSAEVFRVPTAAEAQGSPHPTCRSGRGEKGGRRREPPSEGGGHHGGVALPGGCRLYRAGRDRRPCGYGRHRDLGGGVRDRRDGKRLPGRLRHRDPSGHDPPAAPCRLSPQCHIVPGITEAFEIIAKNFDRGYLGFITGPSRTADIERVLTIGVHGPGRFAIIAVDEEPKGGDA